MAPVSTFYWILCFISIGFSFLFLFFDKFLAKFEKSICFLIKSMVWLICYERLFIYCRIFGLQIIILCWICNLLPHESKAHHYRALCLIFIKLPLQPIGRGYLWSWWMEVGYSVIPFGGGACFYLWPQSHEECFRTEKKEKIMGRGNKILLLRHPLPPPWQHIGCLADNLMWMDSFKKNDICWNSLTRR